MKPSLRLFKATPHQSRAMLPQNASFLDHYDWKKLDSGSEISIGEKQLLIMLLRIFFGSSMRAGDVKNVSDPNSLSQLAISMQQPGERFELLESQTNLPSGYFKTPLADAGSHGIYAALKANGSDAPSYFVYESRENLVFYIGPDFLHGEPGSTVINCLTLDLSFKPDGSYTLRTK